MAASASGGMVEHPALMARYNRWAHELLWRAVSTLPAGAVTGAVGLPFGSIAATYNHILAADVLWYCRVTGAKEAAGLAAEALNPYWAHEPSGGQWDTLPWSPPLHDVVARILAMNDRWAAYLATLTPAALEAPLVYRNTSGAEVRKLLGPALAHVFNHATHHRCVPCFVPYRHFVEDTTRLPTTTPLTHPSCLQRPDLGGAVPGRQAHPAHGPHLLPGFGVRGAGAAAGVGRGRAPHIGLPDDCTVFITYSTT